MGRIDLNKFMKVVLVFIIPNMIFPKMFDLENVSLNGWRTVHTGVILAPTHRGQQNFKVLMRYYEWETFLFKKDLPQEKHVLVGHVFVWGDAGMRIHKVLYQSLRSMFCQKQHILLNDRFWMVYIGFR